MTEKETLTRIKGLILQADRKKEISRAYLRDGNLAMAEAFLTISKWVFRSIKIYENHLTDLRDRKPIKVDFT